VTYGCLNAMEMKAAYVLNSERPEHPRDPLAVSLASDEICRHAWHFFDFLTGEVLEAKPFLWRTLGAFGEVAIGGPPVGIANPGNHGCF